MGQRKVVRLLPLALTFITTAAFTQESRQSVLIVHDKVGAEIDSSESQRFHLFNQDVGLRAARVYELSKNKTKKLHLIGTQNGRSWMLTPGLSASQFDDLIKRVDAASAETFEEPIYKIDLPQALLSDSASVRIKLVDGSSLYGQITACDSDSITFQTISGVDLEISEASILKVSLPQGEISGGEFVRFDPSNNRLLFGPTGRTLRKGEWYFADFYIFFPTIAVGVTDRLQIGGGMSLIPLASQQLFYLSPKLTLVHQPALDFAVGFTYMGIPDTEANFTAGYSTLSIGTPLRGITFGLFLPFETENYDLDATAILFGAETQTSNNVKLITENWLLTDGDDSLLLISGGIRLIGENLTADFALWTSPEFLDEGVGFPFIPYLNFAVSFGK